MPKIVVSTDQGEVTEIIDLAAEGFTSETFDTPGNWMVLGHDIKDAVRLAYTKEATST